MAKRGSRTCGRCGTTAGCADGGLPPGWSIEVEGRRTIYICDACIRSNLRALEAKLPQEYWEW